MNQEKIGRFIAACRKDAGLTQAELAEKLNITDRAVSKWETGRSTPDSSIMLELCTILGISVNELLTGERITMQEYDKKAEENLLEMRRREENANRLLLRLEIALGISMVAISTACVLAAGYAVNELLWRIVLIAAAILTIVVFVVLGLKIEREAGWYVCKCCGNHYVPSRWMIYSAMHMGRIRYMKCPQCGKWSWQKKALTKEE